MLVLTFKIYYGVVITWISWLHNLFHDLMANCAWNNIITTKAIKLWKLVTGATDLEIRMQGHSEIIAGGDWLVVDLHVEFELNIASSKLAQVHPYECEMIDGQYYTKTLSKIGGK